MSDYIEDITPIPFSGITIIPTVQPPDSSDYSVSLRRSWVADMYLNNIPSSIIFDQYKVRYGLSKPSFDKDIQKVRETIAEPTFREQVEEILLDQYKTLQTILVGAMNTGNTSTAISAIKEITALTKLVLPHGNIKKQVNVQVNNFDPASMSVEQILTNLNRLRTGDKTE